MAEAMAASSVHPNGWTLLEVDGISKSFGTVAALRNLSFSASPGEIIGLLGPNGAGKTTAMRILSTILSPESGSFSLDGIPHTKPAEIRRRIGVLPESSGYPLQWSGSEYLHYYARLYGSSASEARRLTLTLLTEVGLADRARSPVSTYSWGMRQRLGLARALVNEPSVLLLDEPTLGLDPAGQRQVLDLIRGVAERRVATVIVSTHFLDEVEEVCSRVIILNHGEVVAQGSIAEILRRAIPRSCRVRVPPDSLSRALAVVSHAPGVVEASGVEGEEGVLRATFDPDWLERQDGAGANSVVRALSEAQVPILSFDLRGGSLNEAFLSLTEGASDE
jgi:ABC-2 type transport system ATP-binding protein